MCILVYLCVGFHVHVYEVVSVCGVCVYLNVCVSVSDVYVFLCRCISVRCACVYVGISVCGVFMCT